MLHPGDVDGNGLLRRVTYKMPFGRSGTAIELVTDVVAERGTRTGWWPGNPARTDWQGDPRGGVTNKTRCL